MAGNCDILLSALDVISIVNIYAPPPPLPNTSSPSLRPTSAHHDAALWSAEAQNLIALILLPDLTRSPINLRVSLLPCSLPSSKPKLNQTGPNLTQSPTPKPKRKSKPVQLLGFGIDHVICLDELKLSMLAVSTLCPAFVPFVANGVRSCAARLRSSPAKRKGHRNKSR